MRELTSHKVNGCNDDLKIEVLDEPGHGGASHLYEISGFSAGTNPAEKFMEFGERLPASNLFVLFQNGPIKEVGTNGVTHEALLAILIDRLEGFQSGKFACEDNQDALDALKAAREILHNRTLARLDRGVEGTHTV